MSEKLQERLGHYHGRSSAKNVQFPARRWKSFSLPPAVRGHKCQCHKSVRHAARQHNNDMRDGRLYFQPRVTQTPIPHITHAAIHFSRASRRTNPAGASRRGFNCTIPRCRAEPSPQPVPRKHFWKNIFFPTSIHPRHLIGAPGRELPVRPRPSPVSDRSRPRRDSPRYRNAGDTRDETSASA